MKFFTVTKQAWAAALAVGVLAIGCFAAQPDSRLNGTWVGTMNGDNVELKFKNGTFESIYDGIPGDKGTYTTDKGTLTMDATHVFGGAINASLTKQGLRGVNFESKWYSATGFVVELRSFLLKSGVPAELADELVYVLLTTPPATYSVDDKSLILTFSLTIRGESHKVVGIFTRKER